MNKNDVLTDPKKLVAFELKNAGFDIDSISVPQKVYLLADSYLLSCRDILSFFEEERTGQRMQVIWKPGGRRLHIGKKVHYVLKWKGLDYLP